MQEGRMTRYSISATSSPLLTYVHATTRQLRRKSTSSRHRRTLIYLAFLIALILYSIFHLDLLCSLLPGLCPSFTATTRTILRQQRRLLQQQQRQKKGTDPFQGLTFESLTGYLFYPATASLSVPVNSASTAAVIPVPLPQPHPIHLLMAEAQQNWTRKASTQSKSLKEAVAEYERRYNRRPPKGFADWYWYAKGKETLLIDEYDSIHHRILPFMALPSSVLQERSQMLQFDSDFWMANNAFTLTIQEHGRKINIVGPMKDVNDRPEQMKQLIQGFARFLPDMNLTITGHDSPWVVISGEKKAKHIAAASAKTLLAPEEYLDAGEIGNLDGFAVICPPNSSIRTAGYFDERKADWTDPTRGSYIRDHEATMDTCEHPERQALHGFTAWTGPRPGYLFPLFTSCTTSMHSDLLLPPVDQYDSEQGVDCAWSDKTNEKVVWRGSTTGSDLTIPHMRTWSQRPRLCRLAKQTGSLTLDISPFDTPTRPGLIDSFTASAVELAEHYFDIKFLGPAHQCGTPEMCAEFEKEFEWDKYMTPDEQNTYKYVLDVDGNGWSGRFHRLMSSNSVVLKSTIFPEWYTERVQPWFHYIPISTDYSDLWSIMAFFRGDLNGRGAHDALAEKIAANGKIWADEMWHWSDMEVYFFRLLLEYARVMNRDEKDPTNMDM